MTVPNFLGISEVDPMFRPDFLGYIICACLPLRHRSSSGEKEQGQRAQRWLGRRSPKGITRYYQGYLRGHGCDSRWLGNVGTPASGADVW